MTNMPNVKGNSIENWFNSIFSLVILQRKTRVNWSLDRSLRRVVRRAVALFSPFRDKEKITQIYLWNRMRVTHHRLAIQIKLYCKTLLIFKAYFLVIHLVFIAFIKQKTNSLFLSTPVPVTARFTIIMFWPLSKLWLSPSIVRQEECLGKDG